MQGKVPLSMYQGFEDVLFSFRSQHQKLSQRHRLPFYAICIYTREASKACCLQATTCSNLLSRNRRVVARICAALHNQCGERPVKSVVLLLLRFLDMVCQNESVHLLMASQCSREKKHGRMLVEPCIPCIISGWKHIVRSSQLKFWATKYSPIAKQRDIAACLMPRLPFSLWFILEPIWMHMIGLRSLG